MYCVYKILELIHIEYVPPFPFILHVPCYFWKLQCSHVLNTTRKFLKMLMFIKMTQSKRHLRTMCAPKNPQKATTTKPMCALFLCYFRAPRTFLPRWCLPMLCFYQESSPVHPRSIFLSLIAWPLFIIQDSSLTFS